MKAMTTRWRYGTTSTRTGTLTAGKKSELLLGMDSQPATHSPPQGALRLTGIVLPGAILAATFLAYVGALSFEFVFDDQAGIVRNGSLRAWHYLPSYFTSHVWSFLYPHLLSNYYRPLFLLWLRVNFILFGLNPWGWHLTSVLAHLAVTFMVYRLALRLIGDDRGAAAAALVFGLHPVHVEAVAYVSAVPEVLSTLCLLGALLAWVRSREPASHPAWMLASVLLFCLALLAKESGMMLPVFVAIYAWVYCRSEGGKAQPARRLGTALLAASPFLAATVPYIVLRVWALKGFAHTVTPVALRTEILTIPAVLAFYLRLLLWPLGLSCYYDLSYVSAVSVRGFLLPLAAVLAAAVTLLVWYLWMRRSQPQEARGVAFAALWMLAAILPVLNFRLLPEGEIAHDRYLYLPSVGFSLLVGLAVVQVLGASKLARLGRTALVSAAVAAGLVLGLATLRQSLYWSDDLSLNFRAHQIAPHNVYATTSLGAAVAARGMVGPAMALYQQALAIQPNFWRANVNMGYLDYAQGNYEQAARYFSRACAADPTDGDQFLYLGMSLLRTGRTSEAENAIRTALVVRPGGTNYHLGLAMVLMQEGKLAEAKHEVETELAADPQNAQARALMDEIDKKAK